MTERTELTRQVIDATTVEQRRIGQVIHDGVAQELAGLRYMAQTHAESLVQQSSSEAKTAQRIAQWLESIQRELRGVIGDLIPAEVYEKGLVAGLEKLAARTTQFQGVTCVFDFDECIALRDPALSMHLYQIALEAVNNALRHAHARVITIRLSEGSDVLTLQVADDGVGVGSVPAEKPGTGLRSMRYRACLIGARLNTENAEGGGTVVTCEVQREPAETGKQVFDAPRGSRPKPK
jgi:signal transduction histidine kinase